MEEALQDRIRELAKSRADYDDLLDKFRQSNHLFDEKETLYKEQLKQSQHTIELWKEKYYKVKTIVNEHNELKQSFQQDVKILQETAKLLDQREQDLHHSMELLKDMNQKLTLENQEYQNQIQILEEKEIIMLRKCQEEMISKEEHDALVKKYQALQHIIEFDMISKVQYHQVEDDNHRLKQRIEQQCVDRRTYQEILQRFETLDSAVNSGQYIKRDDYERLLLENQSLNEDKRVIEASVRIVNEMKDQSMRQSEEKDVTIHGLQKKIELIEKDMQQLTMEHHHISIELQQKREEILRHDEERKQSLEKVMSLENQKSTLLTQLGQVKLSLRNETEQRKDLQQQVKIWEGRLESAKLEFSKELIEHNQKLNEVFSGKERTWQQRFADLELQCTVLDRESKEYCRVKEELEQKVHQLDEMNQELSKTIAVKEVYEDTTQRDIQRLHQDRSQLQLKNAELTTMLEELRINVMSELSPSFRKYFNNGTLSPGGDSMVTSQGLGQSREWMSGTELRHSPQSQQERRQSISEGGNHPHPSPSQSSQRSTFSALDINDTPTPVVTLATQFVSSHRPSSSSSLNGFGYELPRSTQSSTSSNQAQLRRSPPSPKTSMPPSPRVDHSVPSIAIPRTNTPPKLRPAAAAAVASQRSQFLQNNNATNQATPQPSRFNMSLNHSGAQWKSPQLTPATATSGARHSALARQLLQAKNGGTAQIPQSVNQTSSNKPSSPTRRPITPPSPSSPVLRRSRSDSNKMDDHSVIREYTDGYD